MVAFVPHGKAMVATVEPGLTFKSSRNPRTLLTSGYNLLAQNVLTMEYRRLVDP